MSSCHGFEHREKASKPAIKGKIQGSVGGYRVQDLSELEKRKQSVEKDIKYSVDSVLPSHPALKIHDGVVSTHRSVNSVRIRISSSNKNLES